MRLTEAEPSTFDLQSPLLSKIDTIERSHGLDSETWFKQLQNNDKQSRYETATLVNPCIVNHGWLMSLLHADETFDIEYAASLASRSLQLMAEHGVAATPANFTLWFNYVLGGFPNLNHEINSLVANEQEFDLATNQELYATFVKQQAGAAVPAEVEAIIANARDYLAVAISDNRTQIEALDEASSDLVKGQDAAGTIKWLQNELRKATNRAAATEAKLATNSAELKKIKESLAEAEARSKTDALTGLANRHMLDEYLKSSLLGAAQQSTALSVFMLDIDHFKKFNDRYGHPLGDQVLRLVSQVMQGCLREADLAARYGGEELMAVLAGAGLKECHDAAERVRTKICGARITRRATGEDIGTVTVSIGATRFLPGESSEALVQRCDGALYLAKKLGRNRTVTVDELGTQRF